MLQPRAKVRVLDSRAPSAHEALTDPINCRDFEL